VEIQEIISSGILESYAMGIATEEEMQQVTQWLKQFPQLRQELEAIENSLEAYAMAHAIAPAAPVKDALIQQLQLHKETSGPAKIVPLSNRWKWVAAASILLLLGTAMSSIIYYNKYKKSAEELALAHQELDTISKQNEEMAKSGRVISDPNSIPVSLKGLESMPDAKAKIFWMQNSGDVFIDASNLPAAPEGKQYQFWAIVNGVPVDGGLILKTKNGSLRLQRMKSFGKADAFAISLEKEGGNPTPTQVVSLGKTT
jgi:anti-sigma-K factor RskA